MGDYVYRILIDMSYSYHLTRACKHTHAYEYMIGGEYVYRI